jgi:hypothetical protein
MTGLAPEALLAGGRDYFDALVELADERSRHGYQTDALLSSLIELNHAQLRVLLGLGGSKHIPEPFEAWRPGDGTPEKAKRKASTWRDLANKNPAAVVVYGRD